MKVNFNVKAVNFSVALYLSLFYVFSLTRGFLFFEDSRNYKEGVFYAPVLSELLYLYPVSAAVIGLLNLLIVYNIFKKNGVNLFVLFLLTPYNLILVTNATKESIIFIGVFLFFSNNFQPRKKITYLIQKVLSLVMFVARPIYLFLLIVRVRLGPVKVFLLLVLFVFLVTWIYMTPMASLGLDGYFEGRENVKHTGRDFYNYLCVPEKSSLFDFARCWGAVFIGLPVHEDTLSINYLIFLSFQFPFFVISVFGLISKSRSVKLTSIVAVIFHFIVFYISPTLGAFIRYSHPVLWILGFSLLYSNSLINSRFVIKRGG